MNLAMKWIDDLRGTDSIREVSRKAGIPQPTLARQVNNDQLSFETVRDVARAYGRPVIADLIALGFLTAGDAGIEGIDRALAAATDEQLVVEVGRRLDVTPSSMVWDAPVSEAVARSEATVHYPDFNSEPVDDERAVASEISDDDGEDTNYDD